MLGKSAVVRCIPISRAVLEFLGDRRDDLVIINLGGSGAEVLSGALNIPMSELAGMLHWLPPKTTLVLCGATGPVSLPKNVLTILADRDVQVVYIIAECSAKSMAV
jgi:hypothetical protein